MAGKPAAGKKTVKKTPKKPAASKAPPLVNTGEVPVVYLDANVLIPEYSRSTFLDLAYKGLIQVHWGEEVLDEVRRNLVKPKFGLTDGQVDTLFADLNHAFPDGLVLGSALLEPLFAGETDKGDQHVAAGALKASQLSVPPGAVVLVTSNMKHLPEKAFVGTNVRPARPSAFLTALLVVEPRVAQVLAEMLLRFKKPVVSKDDYLATMDRSNCKGFVTALAAAWGLVPVGP